MLTGAPELFEFAPSQNAVTICLSEVSRWHIGGVAERVFTPTSIEDVRALVADLAGMPWLVIGATSNLLFADEGLYAPCIRIGGPLGRIEVRGEEVWAEAGVWVPGFALTVMRAGLTGVEHVAGIPGTIGGLLCMNGGSQRRGIGENVVEVVSVDRAGKLRRRDRLDCGFGYRRSVFQGNGEIVVAARFRFAHTDDKAAVRRTMLTILADRRRKFPQKEANCGSVFVSDPALYAEFGPPGAIIERLGLKGTRIGGAEVSPRHANWISNRGGATARDVLALVALIHRRVLDATGHSLRAEALYVTPEGNFLPLHVAADKIPRMGNNLR